MADNKEGKKVCQRKQDYSYECQGNSLTYVRIGYQGSEIIRHASIPLIQSTSALPE